MDKKIIDTHAHLQFAAFAQDLDAVLQRIKEKDISAINVGVDFISSKNAVTMAEKYEGLYAAVGLHPTDVDEPLDVQAYRQLAASKKVVAIGEIGLDYLKNPKKEKQKDMFLAQADLAAELDLPVIIHCRMAHDDMIAMLQTRKHRGVIHCFTGTLEQAKKYVELGFYLGINGIIFKFDIDEVIKNIPLTHLLLETDCPYLTPPMAPQKRNEPVFMEYTIQKIAALKGVSTDEVADQTTQNAKKVFNIP